MLEDQIAEAVHELAALGGVHIPPDGVLEGGASRLDGAVDVLRITGGQRGEHLACRRVDRLEGLAVCRIDPLATDQHAVVASRKRGGIGVCLELGAHDVLLEEWVVGRARTYAQSGCTLVAI